MIWRALLLSLSGVVIAIAASAHDGATAVDLWYRSLQAPDGTSCCSMRDCSPVDARIVDGKWQVKAGEEWLPVAPEAVLRRENQDGRPIACIVQGFVKCFVEPAGA